MEEENIYNKKIQSEYLNIIYPIVDKRESLYVAYSIYRNDLIDKRKLNTQKRSLVIQLIRCIFAYLQYYKSVKEITDEKGKMYDYKYTDYLLNDYEKPLNDIQVKKLYRFIRKAINVSGIEDIEKIKRDFSKEQAVKGESRY